MNNKGEKFIVGNFSILTLKIIKTSSINNNNAINEWIFNMMKYPNRIQLDQKIIKICIMQSIN